MKKSVINEFEKRLREKMSCWEHVSIVREDHTDFVSFYIKDEDSCESMTSPVLSAAIDMEYAFECMHGLCSCNLIVGAETVEHIAYTGARPFIRMSINKK